MRALIQRTTNASVSVLDNVVGTISTGLVVLLGIEESDTKEDVLWLSNKIGGLRIFNDAGGVMNLSLKDVEGDVLLISQFTLHASTKKGNRPSYIRASKPEQALPLYQLMMKQLEQDLGKPVQKGVFGADMKVNLINDGPVTIFIDTKNRE